MRGVALTLLITLALAGCGDGGHDHGAHSAHDDHAGHAHTAPHGGTLIVCGAEVAHVELVLDAATGTLTAYVLDGEAERAIRLPQRELRLTCTVGEQAIPVTLAAQANVRTGETPGDSSQFVGRHAALVGQARWRGTLDKIHVLGQTYEHVAFRFPEGNE